MKPNFWLFFLYFTFISLSIFSSILLLIVVLLLRRFDVFHINLRILLWQTLICIILNLSVQILRPILLLIQNDEFKIENPADNCPELNEFPAPFCLFICFSGILICMERLYATFNFAKYENEQFEWILSKIFGAMWLFVGFYSIIDFCFDLFPVISKIGYLDCRMHQIRINPLKSNWHLLFTILFHCVFCLVISVVLSVNKEKQEVYVKLHYSSLSHRFQIAENVKSVRLLLKIVPQLGLAVALLLFHSVWLYIDSINRTEMELLIRAECGLLIMQQNLHRLPIRLLKAMTVTSEYSEEFPQIPLKLLSEEFSQCEKKCWNNWKNEDRICPDNFIGTRILASIANDFDQVRMCISPGAKCLDIGFSVLTAPNILADSNIASSILHWIAHFRGCEFESVYLRAALNAELFHLMGVKLICRELKLVTRLYINEFEQVIQFLDDFVQAETISLDFLDVLELDTRNPVMFGNILILRKFILFGVQKCNQSFTLSHCKLDLKFFIGIVQEFQSNGNTKMIPSCKFNFNSSAVPWPELAENNEFKNAQVKKEEESEIGCQNQTYKFQKNLSTNEEDLMQSLEIKFFFIGNAISAVHLNVKFN